MKLARQQRVNGDRCAPFIETAWQRNNGGLLAFRVQCEWAVMRVERTLWALFKGGCLTVQPGEVFLASQTPRSLDGRYFGMTRIRDLTAQAVPLWIWR